MRGIDERREADLATAATCGFGSVHSVDSLARAYCPHREGLKTFLRATDNPSITATSVKQAKSDSTLPHQPLPKLATARALHRQPQEVRTPARIDFVSLTRAYTCADWRAERVTGSVTSARSANRRQLHQQRRSSFRSRDTFQSEEQDDLEPGTLSGSVARRSGQITSSLRAARHPVL